LVRVEPPEIDDDLGRDTLVAAIDRDLEAATRIGSVSCSAADRARALGDLRQAASLPDTDLADYVRARFEFYRSGGREGGALFTGYFEPILDGRRRREGAFVHPLYRRPDDLIEIRLGDFADGWAGVTIYGRVAGGKLAPYYTRREIDGDHVLDGRGLETAWLDDPVARYFLQVQGSGILRLEDGTELRVGFAGSNGKPYTSIGRLLVDDGSLLAGQATAPAIQAFLRAHPERRDEILFHNERYVFFREVADGPIGRLGVKLTAGRSIAVDVSLYPLGTLAYVETQAPRVDSAGQPAGRRPLHRLVLAQDSGAAIAGPGRVDLFFGTGDAAGLVAGSMSSRGELYFLVPRECAR
jgi:membrane-bound lytic murein transglycosylase A